VRPIAPDTGRALRRSSRPIVEWFRTNENAAELIGGVFTTRAVGLPMTDARTRKRRR
jgi:hypothetical protein